MAAAHAYSQSGKTRRGLDFVRILPAGFDPGPVQFVSAPALTTVLLEAGEQLNPAVFRAAIYYLRARHQSSLTVWDVVNDPLLRESAMASQPKKRQFMMLDPSRRWFTRSEVTAAWLRQNRGCIDCHRTIPRDLTEGDHIIPWSKGGRTTMDNLHARCVACNRRKGNREVAVYSIPEKREIHAGDGRLRERQLRALRFVHDTTDPVLIEACPGAGKTRFALEAAYRMFESGEVNRILAAAPTVLVVQQWVQEAEGRGPSPEATVGTGRVGDLPSLSMRPLCGAAFTWATVQ